MTERRSAVFDTSYAIKIALASGVGKRGGIANKTDINIPGGRSSRKYNRLGGD
jgi:hypothetical protein